MLTQQEAADFDAWLMSDEGGAFSLEQLTELAGQSVAFAVCDLYPQAQSILVLCGPGNNGGDGLVTARHLGMNRKVEVFQPIEGRNPYFKVASDENVTVLKWSRS